MPEQLRSFSRSGVAFVVLIAIWWIITGLGFVSRAYLPSPPAVSSALLDGLRDGSLLDNMSASIVRLVVGYAIASILGIVVGVLMGLIPGIGRFFRPVLSFFNSLSGITWLPLAIAWFGIGPLTIGFVIFNSVFFIVAISTLSGVQSVPKVYENALLTLGGKPLDVVTQVLIPGAMPSVITGLRLGMGFGWRALIAVEMVAGSVGMGYLIFQASYYFQQNILLAGILVIGVIALILDRVIFEPLERRTIECWGLV